MFFSKKKILSLDMGSNRLKFCVGFYEKNRLNIDKIFSEELADGVIENGNIIEYNILLNTIKESFKKHNINSKNIIFTINSSDVIKRDVEVDFIDDDDQESLIKFEIEKFIPTDIENYIMQYKPLDKIPESDKIKYMVALMPKSIVEDYIRLSKDLKMKPLIMDIHCNSINKLLIYENNNSAKNDFVEKNHLLIDIGFNNINVIIIENGFYKFDRRIHSGLSEVQSIMTSTPVNKLTQEDFMNSLEYKNPDFTDTIDYWVSEIRKIMTYYENTTGDKKIDRAYLYGGGAYIKHLNFYLQKHLKIKVDLLGSDTQIDFNDKIEDRPYYNYMNAIGAFITE